MEYGILGQRDARWAGHLLGNSGESTIGGWGCLLVSFAMLTGADVLALNEWLKAHGGYQAEPRGGYAASFDVAGFNPAVKMRNVVTDYLNVRVPDAKLAALMQAISPSRPHILMVDHIPGVPNVKTHFMLAIDVSRNGQIVILDPWFGDIASFNRYGLDYGVSICEWIEYAKGTSSEVSRG